MCERILQALTKPQLVAAAAANKEQEARKRTKAYAHSLFSALAANFSVVAAAAAFVSIRLARKVNVT